MLSFNCREPLRSGSDEPKDASGASVHDSPGTNAQPVASSVAPLHGIAEVASGHHHGPASASTSAAPLEASNPYLRFHTAIELRQSAQSAAAPPGAVTVAAVFGPQLRTDAPAKGTDATTAKPGKIESLSSLAGVCSPLHPPRKAADLSAHSLLQALLHVLRSL